MRERLQHLVARWWAVGIAVVVGVWWLVEVAAGVTGGNDAVAYAFAVLIPLAFAFSRQSPFGAPTVVAGLFLAHSAIDLDSLIHGAASGIMSYAVVSVYGTQERARERFVGLAIVIGASLSVYLRIPEGEITDVSTTELIISTTIVYALVWSVAWLVAGRVRQARTLRERAEEIEREREKEMRAAVADERARIARELHDVVAHSVSVMTVQAGGVRRLLDPERTREIEALQAIEDTGRQALAEMRRMVGVMRTGGGDADGRAPQPGLAHLERLIAETESAGLPVTLSVDGTPRPVAPGVDLSAYRIVQESLTNALKHAGPARAWVTVRYALDRLEVEVADDGRGRARNGALGHGLIGMRERVAVYGGTLHADDRDGGGFRVRAVLPADPAGER